LFGIYKWILIFVLAGAIISLGLWYYRDTQQRIQTLVENASRLQTAVAEQTEAIESMTKDLQLIEEARRQIDAEFKRASDRVRALEEKLSNHELDYLAKNKPVLVERRINQATKDMNRCFEIISGSPLTLQEIDAVLPSQINSICPDLANPNYIPRQ
jgi:chromosome segregation ATPase